MLGIVLILSLADTVWPLKITVADGIENGLFGSSVSMNSKILAIGSMGDRYQNKKHTGSVYVFSQLSTNKWTLNQKLYPDRVQPYDQFGCSLYVGSDILFAGALNSKESNVNTGKVFIWLKDGSQHVGTWSQQGELFVPDLHAYDEFGKEIAFSHNTIAVSAPGDDDMGRDCGAVYIFHGEGASVWSLQAKLVVEDGAREDQSFGSALSIDDNGLLVGSSEGKVVSDRDVMNSTVGNKNSGEVFNVYYFESSGAVAWSLQARLTHPERKSNDQFGWSTALSGDTAIVGARYDESEVGAAYVFSKKRCSAVTCWTLSAKLLPSDTVASKYFGDQIVLDGSIAMIGAYGWIDKSHGNAVTGCMYVFHMDQLTTGRMAWRQQARVAAKDSQPESYFGRSLAYLSDNGAIAVGASSATLLDIPTGAVYLYRYSDGLVIDDHSSYEGGSDQDRSSIAGSRGHSVTPMIGVGICVALCTLSLWYYMCCRSSKSNTRRHMGTGDGGGGFSCLNSDDSIHDTSESDDFRGAYELTATDVTGNMEGDSSKKNQLKIGSSDVDGLDEGMLVIVSDVKNPLGEKSISMLSSAEDEEESTHCGEEDNNCSSRSKRENKAAGEGVKLIPSDDSRISL
jgi:hypothetical protein